MESTTIWSGGKCKILDHRRSPRTRKEVEAFCVARNMRCGLLKKTNLTHGYREYSYYWRDISGRDHKLGNYLYHFTYEKVLQLWNLYDAAGQTEGWKDPQPEVYAIY